MIILWVNIRVQSPPSLNSVFGTTWLRFSSGPQFQTRARNPVGPQPDYHASRQGLSVCIALMCHFFYFWLSGRVFALRKQGHVTYFGWKTLLTNPRHFSSQQSTSHATQGLITPGEPQWSHAVVLPLHGTVVAWLEFSPVGGPGNEPRSLAQQCWHATMTQFSQFN